MDERICDVMDTWRDATEGTVGSAATVLALYSPLMLSYQVWEQTELTSMHALRSYSCSRRHRILSC